MPKLQRVLRLGLSSQKPQRTSRISSGMEGQRPILGEAQSNSSKACRAVWFVAERHSRALRERGQMANEDIRTEVREPQVQPLSQLLVRRS
jgi:hypothetical protein